MFTTSLMQHIMGVFMLWQTQIRHLELFINLTHKQRKLFEITEQLQIYKIFVFRNIFEKVLLLF